MFVYRVQLLLMVMDCPINENFSMTHSCQSQPAQVVIIMNGNNNNNNNSKELLFSVVHECVFHGSV